MKKRNLLACFLVPLLGAAAVVETAAGGKKFWTEGHGDLVIDYAENEWKFQIWDHDPEDVVVVLGQSAKLLIPDSPTFQFLGEPEEPIWVIPQNSTPGVPNLGMNTPNIQTGTFQNNRLDLLLSSVSGPGDFIMWVASGPTDVQVLMNSRDGITEADRDANRPAPGHWHQNWAFTAPGTYQVGLKASAILSATSALIPHVSEEEIFHFEVNVLKEGEVDLEIVYKNGEWEIVLLDEESGEEFETNEAALHLGPATWRRVPSDPAFAFLGRAGAPIFVLPQDEREGVLFLGIAGDEIPEGVFANDTVHLNLVSVDGPGDLFLYQTDLFGAPNIFFNTRDGISEADRFPVAVGRHAHLNWVFSEPGVYRVNVQASGILAADGQASASEVAGLIFEVFAPVIYSEGEIEIEVEFENGELEIVLLDEEADAELNPAEVVLQAGPNTRQTIPTDARYAFLGQAGETIYVLPQDEEEEMIFLGISGDHIPSGIFVDDQVHLKLEEVEGPGHVFLYQVDAFGAPIVFFNSADGLSAEDRFPVKAGSHSHQNLAFSKPGIYRITVEAEGVLVEGNETIRSEEVVFTFDILDLELDGTGPVLSIVRQDADTLLLSWETEPGATYQLQSRVDLGAGAWINEGDAITGTGESLEVEVPIGESPAKFFRITAGM